MSDALNQDRTAWFTVSEAAKETGLSPSTLYRYEKAGRIAPSRTLGGHRRYTRESVEGLIEQMRGAA